MVLADLTKGEGVREEGSLYPMSSLLILATYLEGKTHCYMTRLGMWFRVGLMV